MDREHNPLCCPSNWEPSRRPRCSMKRKTISRRLCAMLHTVGDLFEGQGEWSSRLVGAYAHSSRIGDVSWMRLTSTVTWNRIDFIFSIFAAPHRKTASNSRSRCCCEPGRIHSNQQISIVCVSRGRSDANAVQIGVHDATVWDAFGKIVAMNMVSLSKSERQLASTAQPKQVQEMQNIKTRCSSFAVQMFAHILHHFADIQVTKVNSSSSTSFNELYLRRDLLDMLKPTETLTEMTHVAYFMLAYALVTQKLNTKLIHGTSTIFEVNKLHFIHCTRMLGHSRHRMIANIYVVGEGWRSGVSHDISNKCIGRRNASATVGENETRFEYV